MADDRPAESETDAITRLQRELDDFKTTANARLSRRPTGDIEQTWRTTPKPDTLILNGQVVSRTTYAVLWQWVQDQALVYAGMFTAGDGSTTFGLPDFRGQLLRGMAAGETIGQVIGADTKTITTGNLPAHNHGVSVANHTNHADHDHNNSVGTVSNHNGHNAGSVTVASAAPGAQDFFFSVASTTQNGAGGHNHVVDVFLQSLSAHSAHSVTESSVGSGTALDVRQASRAVNVLVWV